LGFFAFLGIVVGLALAMGIGDAIGIDEAIGVAIGIIVCWPSAAAPAVVLSTRTPRAVNACLMLSCTVAALSQTP
jgi:hypothetical protein